LGYYKKLGVREDNAMRNLLSRCSSIALIAGVLMWTQADAQVGATMTVGGLITQVQQVIQDLKNAGTTLGGNGSKVVAGTTAQLSDLLNQLQQIVGDDLGKQVDQLSGSALEISARMQASVQQLNELIDNQRNCSFLQAEEFVAGVNTVGLQLLSQLPFAKKDAPRVYSFTFSGHAPDVIPKSGGRVTFQGYRLSVNGQPDIKIWDEKRDKTLLEPKSEPASNEDDTSTVIDSDFIANHVGETLQVEIKPKTHRGVLQRLWPSGTTSDPDVFLPVVIPVAYNTTLMLTAWTQYNIPGTARVELPPLEFQYFSTSCGDRYSVNNDTCTVTGIPAGGRIVDFKDQPLGDRNPSQIQINHTNDALTASGWVDSPTCISFKVPPFGPTVQKLVASSIYNHNITPVIEYPVSQTKSSGPVVAQSAMTLPTTSLSVDIPKEKSSATTFWFQIATTTGPANIRNKVFYKSPHLTNSIAGNSNFSDTSAAPFLVDDNFSPTLVNGKAQLSVKVTLPQCGL
jgi:hypothetical protein